MAGSSTIRNTLQSESALQRFYERTADRLGILLKQRDELVPPSRVFADPDRVDGSNNVREFIWIGESTTRWLLECGLQAHHRVLEIGCGIGRMAIPLTKFLTSGGSYDGLDITPEKVEYCRRTVGRRHPNFRFKLADIYNEYYNPRGSQQAVEYRFPYEDSSFDFVFLISVFTHMLPDGVSRYLAEISRVMKPGSKTVITFYLSDRPAGDSTYNYSDVCWIDPVEREHCVVFNRDWVAARFAEHGFVIDNLSMVSQRTDLPDRRQDSVVATKT